MAKKTTIKKTSEDDPAQLLYKRKNKSLDLDREVESFAMWSFGLIFAPFILAGLWFLFPLFIPIPIVGLVLGIISLKRIKNNPKKLKGKGFAIAGIIIGAIETITMLIIVIAIIAGLLIS